MKKIKIYFVLVLLSVTTTLSAQVGISTSNPQGSFHVDGAKDNLATGAPTVAQQANDVIVTSDGELGVGTTNPTNSLHVKAIVDPVKIEGLADGNTTTDRLLVIDPTGVVKNIKTLGGLSIPNPAIFRLETAQTNFLNGVVGGGTSVVPMTVVKNTIPGMTYNSGTSTITFPSGTYQMTFVYEASHNASGCSISSYFVDFPLNNTTTRIHSTSAFVQGANAVYGNSVTYATVIPAGRTWKIALGRGVSGNCSGPGNTLAATSTQLLIFRIGD
ncbi:hypothetical protein A0O34_12420 [Chryseobacterium glaciei]|uniref:C1q domain-containing protein n=1 Tax=Chryseobacterium glaciei TaxID=1685010 RepID=A0A172XW85_9FLAO|nr:hypothetical protein [Chryseobacterium glaciei]ANF51267.1 hypothetical protein A0O34_12420 [Chryseobacterium glaciei]